MTFSDFYKWVVNIKNLSNPGKNAHMQMVPAYRKELLSKIQEFPPGAKQAAVLCLFYPNIHNQVSFLLIKRNTYKGVHSAQIAFPGGKIEPQDKDLVHTALRETEEEIGVKQESVEILKKISEVYIPPSHFLVTPYIGICKFTPIFVAQENEVAQIIEVPLNELLNKNCLIESAIQTSYGFQSKVPSFVLGGEMVWGATAMILNEVKLLVQKIK